MATQKQIEANRRNAQNSTGPRTEAGKTRAAFNSVKHGMTARTAVLPHEDPQSYEEVRASLIESYQPVGAGEAVLVEVIANNYWRLVRARRTETASLDLHIQTMKRRNEIDVTPTIDDDAGLASAFAAHYDTFRKLERYQAAIERSYFKAIETLRRAQLDRQRQEEIGSVSQPAPAHENAPLAKAAGATNAVVAEPAASDMKNAEPDMKNAEPAIKQAQPLPAHIPVREAASWAYIPNELSSKTQAATPSGFHAMGT